MTYFNETEKAVQVKMVLDFYDVERTVEHKVWIPKSQIRGGKLTAWIADAKLDEKAPRGNAFADFFDADGNKLEVERKFSAKEKKQVKAFQNELGRTFGKLSFK